MKTIVSLLALVSVAVLFGCTDDAGENSLIVQKNDQREAGQPVVPAVVEEEAELVELRMGVLSSAFAQRITMKHSDENVVFMCSVDNGHFISKSGAAKNVSVHSGDTALWLDREIEGPVFTAKHAFIEIVLKLDGNIIGYAVIEFSREGEISDHYEKIIKSVLFPQVNGEYKNISEEYVETAVKTAIEKYKDGYRDPIVEEEAELVEVARSGVDLSSTYAYEITLKHPDENVVFMCTVNNGHLTQLFGGQLIKTKKVYVKSGIIGWLDRDGISGELWVNHAFIEIVLKKGNIIGYAVVEISTYGEPYARVIKSVLFPKVYGQYQNVSEEYVKTAIEKIKGETEEADL